MFSYVHKQKDNRDIYYFANSSNDAVETVAEVKGNLCPELWDVATGQITLMTQVEHFKMSGKYYTRFPLKLNAVSSTFVVLEK